MLLDVLPITLALSFSGTILTELLLHIAHLGNVSYLLSAGTVNS